MSDEQTTDKYSVKWSEENRSFVGLHENYPSLSWLAGTENKALEGIRRLVELVILEEALKNFEECKHFVEIPNIMTCVSCVTTTQDLEEKIQSLAEQLFKTL